MAKETKGVLDILIIYVCLFFFTELFWLMLYYHTNSAHGATHNELNSQLIFIFAHFHPSEIQIFAPLLTFILAEIILHLIYLYILWYITISLRALFSLRWSTTRYLALGLWAGSVCAIILGNFYWVPHGIFTDVLMPYFLMNRATLKFALSLVLSGWAIVAGLVLVNITLELSRKQCVPQNLLTLTLLMLVILICNLSPASSPRKSSVASAQKPNIFVIGFDALRPDYLSYFNNKRQPTPNFDKFLAESVVFTDTYTPLARTFPTWVSILDATYPIRNKARDDNVNIASVNHSAILSKLLQNAGYHTIYACDDNRFSNINNQDFGFDQVIGASGNAIDFVMSALNNLPLSNLIVSTPIGKLLFPANFANHASAHTYRSDNFIQLLDEAFENPGDKPIFFAAHFNITAWPFYFFNDKQPRHPSSLSLYKNVVTAGDAQLGAFLKLLEKHGLLDHAIFVLMSDHGITLQLAGDRLVSEDFYQGNKKDIQLKRSKYTQVAFVIGEKPDQPDNHNETKTIYIKKPNSPTDGDQLFALIEKANSPTNPQLYGIDTSWGYGNDLLSLKQNHPLLAFRTFGTVALQPHQVKGRSMLLDIAPTILDLLGQPTLTSSDGISLKPYLLNPALALSDQRPIFLETGFTIPELEQENFSVGNVLAQVGSLFQMDQKNGLFSMIPSAVDVAIARRQRGILQGDWLLAYYPSSVQYRVFLKPKPTIGKYIQPAYPVLVNIKTGEWTMDLDSDFAAASPVKTLNSELQEFYGHEMDYYRVSALH